MIILVFVTKLVFVLCQWLRGKGELCDIVVVGGDGQQTLGHSCVLAAHSTVIAAVLQGRLAAQRDWSVVRPLVISIDDVALKNQGRIGRCLHTTF